MKKLFLMGAMGVALVFLSNCSNTKKVTTVPVAKTNYETNVQTVVMANCSPCHIPANGGRKRAYDNFANVKTDIDEIIRRIDMNPTDRGFMPFRKAEKLSDSVINVFKQWKADGLLEK
ncbi:MAG: hypothetical protein NTW29_13110 [Bacteroidetes bacterium]|nr:hypothetical protein [Bacteroidota bacterium]